MAWSSWKILLPVFISLYMLPNTRLPGQERSFSGTVTDTAGIAIHGVTVHLPAMHKGTVTSVDGAFTLTFDNAGNDSVTVVFTCIGYRNLTLTLGSDQSDIPLAVKLFHEVIVIDDVRVTATRQDNITVINIPPVAGAVIPSVSGGVESAIATLPGVSSFSELSSGYSVRGGSYDENLVYINDVEVYRPYLIRTGQQEGLSRINPDLTASVNFSPGGFSAAYGDRMSSVLDITYREPEQREGSISLSLLTSSAHAGARSRDDRFWFIAGARYRSNAILLGSLDDRGAYTPHFADLQAIGGVEPDSRTRLTLSLWGSSNIYTFVPKSRTTTFGTFENAYRLYAYFEGGERDRYHTGGGALTLEKKHCDRYTSKFILSSWIAGEYENYDIRGAYSLMALDRNEGTENRPDTTLNAGVGSWLSHARNSYRSNVTALAYRGTVSSGSNGLEWGVTARYRNYDSYRNEWLRVDSAGFTLGGTGEGLALTTGTDLAVSTGSLAAEGWIISRTHFLIAGRKSNLNAGIRTSYDTYSSEHLVSPRIALRTALSERFSIYIAAGAYHQPPEGRELLTGTDSDGHHLRAQRSWHLTAGARYDFIAWERPFRFTAEAWGKKFNRQVPYLIDNVRLVYYGGNIARGYSAGVDLRVNGEFVPGVESWFSLSLMKSEMMIPSLSTGWYPAPFDQRVHFSIFFQDYLPDHPDFRAHINIAFGTGLPTSPPGMEQWDAWFRMPPYRRIDIGFSKVLIGSPDKT